MRPLGQRPVPKNKPNSDDPNAYTNQAFDFEAGKANPQKWNIEPTLDLNKSALWTA